MAAQAYDAGQLIDFKAHLCQHAHVNFWALKDPCVNKMANECEKKKNNFHDNDNFMMCTPAHYHEHIIMSSSLLVQ